MGINLDQKLLVKCASHSTLLCALPHLPHTRHRLQVSRLAPTSSSMTLLTPPHTMRRTSHKSTLTLRAKKASLMRNLTLLSLMLNLRNSTVVTSPSKTMSITHSSSLGLKLDHPLQAPAPAAHLHPAQALTVMHRLPRTRTVNLMYSPSLMPNLRLISKPRAPAPPRRPAPAPAHLAQAPAAAHHHRPRQAPAPALATMLRLKPTKQVSSIP